MSENTVAADGAPSWTDEQLMLTAEQAAHTLNIGRTTLYALIKDGELRSVHIGRSCRLTRAELLRYVAHLDAPPVQPRPNPSTAARRTRTSANQSGLFDLAPTPSDVA